MMVPGHQAGVHRKPQMGPAPGHVAGGLTHNLQTAMAPEHAAGGRHMTVTVLEHAATVSRTEDYQRDLLRSGRHRFRDVYPLSDELRRAYDVEARPPERP